MHCSGCIRGVEPVWTKYSLASSDFYLIIINWFIISSCSKTFITCRSTEENRFTGGKKDLEQFWIKWCGFTAGIKQSAVLKGWITEIWKIEIIILAGRRVSGGGVEIVSRFVSWSHSWAPRLEFTPRTLQLSPHSTLFRLFLHLESKSPNTTHHVVWGYPAKSVNTSSSHDYNVLKQRNIRVHNTYFSLDEFGFLNSRSWHPSQPADRSTLQPTWRTVVLINLTALGQQQAECQIIVDRSAAGRGRYLCYATPLPAQQTPAGEKCWSKTRFRSQVYLSFTMFQCRRSVQYCRWLLIASP